VGQNFEWPAARHDMTTMAEAVERPEGERRQKGVGGVNQVPCRWCAAPVTIERRAMQWHDERPYQMCRGCDTLIPLRYGDAFAPFTERPGFQQSLPRSRQVQVVFDREETIALLDDLLSLQTRAAEEPERRSKKHRSSGG